MDEEFKAVRQLLPGVVTSIDMAAIEENAEALGLSKEMHDGERRLSGRALHIIED